MNGIRALRKATTESSFIFFLPSEGTRRICPFAALNSALTEPAHAGTLVSKPWEINVCLISHSVSGILL